MTVSVPATAEPRALPDPLAAATVVVAAAAVLVLEILATRLVAPYVGVTLQTNSAIIGVALSAIATGAWAGGAAADRVDPRRALGPLFMTGAALTALTLPAVRLTGALARGGDPSGVVLMAAAAIFLPAAVLSAVSPMVVKLQLADLSSTGTVVGRLSGLATLGAIAGTFLTGFVLVAALPSSAIVLVTATVLFAAGAGLHGWLRRRGAPALDRGPSALVAVVGLLGVGGVLTSPSPCDVETAYHCASVVVDPDRAGGRTLRLDTLRHSYVDLDDPRHLEFAYTQAIGSAVDVLAPPGQPLRALHIGGGGFTLPRYLAATRPGSASTVLEIDPGVVRLDRERLGLRLGPALRVVLGDARVGLARQPATSYDVVVGDAFGGLAVPFHLTTRETVQDVRRVLRPGGIYAANIIDFEPNRLARAAIATVQAVFPHVAVVTSPGPLGPGVGGNFVVLGSDAELPVDELRTRLGNREAPLVLSADGLVGDFVRGAEVLTDDHAPADQLLTPVS